ncbi:hypothetical protein CAPTEDRAFT_114305, partial [Capitella teleta]
VGKPILVKESPEPTQEYIDEIHQQYIDDLCQLFDDHKEKYGVDPSVSLNVI